MELQYKDGRKNRNRILYAECHSGVSGDMTVGALLDLGADQQVLLNALKSLNLDGYSINISQVVKNGIKATDFDVIIETANEGLTEELFIKRNIDDIYTIIHQSDMTENAKQTSKKIFQIVAEAEAEAHKVDIGEVYFHESGAIDSIIDIASAAICLDNLGVQRVIVSELYDGTGFITCRKGIIPVPVPAVVNIVRTHQLTLKLTDIQGEMITPTGAAIMAAIKTEDELPTNYKVKRSGCGTGKRSYPNEGVLRLALIE